MNPETAELLAQLRDIHGAQNPAWWPPAPGWWIVAAILLFLVVMGLHRLLQILRLRQRRKQWLQALQQLADNFETNQDAQEFVADINRHMKAVALQSFPRSDCAALQGQAWVAFVAALLPDASAESMELLASGPYQPQVAVNKQELLAVAEAWVNRYG